MIPLSEINWDPIDANVPDEQFLDKFVEPDPIHQLFDKRYWLLTGEKGSGKSAMRQALKRKYKTNFSSIIDIDFNNIQFNMITANLYEMTGVSNMSKLPLMANYWEYCLINEVITDYEERHVGPKPNTLDDDGGLLKPEIRRGNSITHHMLVLINTCWSWLDEFTHPDKGGSGARSDIRSINITPDVLSRISRYPCESNDFLRKKHAFAETLRQSNEKVLIILDGFDQLQHNAESSEKITLIFEGLAEAIYSLSTDAEFADTVAIKALVPNDRFESMKLRDSDKLSAIHKAIRWDASSLKAFLARRIGLHPRLSPNSSFDQLWSEIMPPTLINPVYNLEEKTFDYLLRHTMYRPRQLQMHLKRLADANRDQPIQANQIPKSVRATNKDLADYYIKEYLLDHPRMNQLLTQYFQRKTNVMTYEEFRAIIKKALLDYNSNRTVEQEISILYRICFFGVIEMLDDNVVTVDSDRYYPPRKAGVRRYRVDFQYTYPRNNVTHSIASDAMVCIHPMILDLVDMTPHPSYIVG